MNRRFIFTQITLTILVIFTGQSVHAGKQLKVYLLAGQSNMEGHAHVSTFPHVGMDPKTKPLLEMMQDAVGKPVVCDNVWISYLTAKDGQNMVKEGKLTTGFGAQAKGPKIGPEFTFGLTLERHLDNPILIIKTAWGGQSLYANFRPPGAGPVVLNDWQREEYGKRGLDLAEITKKRNANVGHRYREMIAHVKKTLANPKAVCPAYDEAAGYEIAGFVWFQGWNDKSQPHVYPNRREPGGYDEYSRLLGHLIRDVRKDLSAPDMQVVIGVLGQGGPMNVKDNPNDKRIATNYYFRQAMMAPAALPEFKDNVTAVQTAKYWDDELGGIADRLELVKDKNRELKRDKAISLEERRAAVEAYKNGLITKEELALYELGASNFAFHYLGSAKMFAQFGQAFAEPLLPVNTR